MVIIAVISAKPANGRKFIYKHRLYSTSKPTYVKWLDYRALLCLWSATTI